ncbi:MAG: hypothetical protein ABW178_03245 [Pseudoxanthomonas sp.]
MLFTIAFIVIAVVAGLVWLATLESSARTGYHEAKVDELDLVAATRQYGLARKEWLRGAHDPALGVALHRDMLERVVFLKDRIEQLQGRAHGPQARTLHRQALSREAEALAPVAVAQAAYASRPPAPEAIATPEVQEEQAPVATATEGAAMAGAGDGPSLEIPAEEIVVLPPPERYFIALRAFEVRRAAEKAEDEALNKPLNILEGLLPVLRAQIRSDYRLGGRGDAPFIAGQIARLVVLTDRVDALRDKPHGRRNRVQLYGQVMAELYANNPDFGVDELLRAPDASDVLVWPPLEEHAPGPISFDAWREQFRLAAEELLRALPADSEVSRRAEPDDLAPLRQSFGAGLDPSQEGRVYALRQVHHGMSEAIARAMPAEQTTA